MRKNSIPLDLIIIASYSITYNGDTLGGGRRGAWLGSMVVCKKYPTVFICLPRFLLYVISLVQKK